MSVKGICHLNSLRPDMSTNWMCIASLSICGLDTANPVGPVQTALSVDPSTMSTTLSATLSGFAQQVLINNGYTFGGGDSVVVVGL